LGKLGYLRHDGDLEKRSGCGFGWQGKKSAFVVATIGRQECAEVERSSKKSKYREVKLGEVGGEVK
jgi:hypothetical protein